MATLTDPVDDACPYCGDPDCPASEERDCPDWKFEKETRDFEEDYQEGMQHDDCDCIACRPWTY